MLPLEELSPVFLILMVSRMEYILIEKKKNASWLVKAKGGFLAITQEACFKDLGYQRK